MRRIIPVVWLRKHGARVSTVVMGLVLALVPLLAFLQYRWIGEVSTAERDRMRASLRGAAFRFADELDGQVSRIFSEVLSARPGWPDRGLEQFGERLERWSESASNPRLVAGLYITRGGERGIDELLRYDRASGNFTVIPWPVGFERLKAQLAAPRDDGPRPGGLFRAVVDTETPALAAPRLTFSSPPPTFGGPPVRFALDGWTIAELDRTFMKEEWLPDLVRHYFPPEYQVKIETPSGSTIFQTGETSFDTPDLRIGLLELRPEPFGRGPGGRGGPKGPRRGPPEMKGPPPPRDPMRAEGRGQWQLLAKHRSGSLEAFVERARLRNLGIGFSVLLLMGVSAAMLFHTTSRAQRLARLQMEFVAGVSHELRTPLSVICSAGDNLADGLVADAQRVKRYGTVIRTEGRRLSEMVEQVMAFAGIDSGRVKLDVKPVEVSRIVEKALAIADAAVRDSGCRVEREVDASLPPALADETSMAHCVGNLIVNAAKHGRSGQWIGVRAVAGGGTVSIAVEDHGPGIERGELDHIFDPFYRGKRAIDGQIHGTGLGLALVRRIIEAHGGRVEVRSTPGAGTTFTVSLPAAVAETPEPVRQS